MEQIATQSEIIYAVAGIAGSFIAAKLLYFIINRYVKSIAKKTKTEIDDELLEVLEKPFITAMLLIGLYFSVIQIDYAKRYTSSINDAIFIFWVILAIFALHR